MSDRVKRWIEVEEQAHPEHGGQVLVTFTLGKYTRYVTAARWDCGRWDWGSVRANFARKDSDIVAWQEMPLPFGAGDDVTAPVMHKLYVWRNIDYLVVAHAKSVAEARQLIRDEHGVDGDSSVPVRAAALKAVQENTPEIHYRTDAELVLSANGETQELELLAITNEQTIHTLRDQSRAKDVEIQQLKDQLLLAQEQVNALSIVKGSNDKTASGN